jgi:hypothetical protein
MIEPSATSALVEGGRVELEHVRALWPHLSPLIRRACERGGGDFAQIERDVLAERALLWIANDGLDVLAVAVTQLWHKGPRKLCTILACGGHHLRRFLPVLEMIERYARNAGCDAMEICGRPGWIRILRDYRIRRVELEKELRR